MMSKQITTQAIRQCKESGNKITVLTAYDYPMAKLCSQLGVDIILVGDSVGQAVLGYNNTLQVTMDDMLHHIKAVSRAVDHSLVVGDMPFLSYQISTEEAVKNAGRFIQEGGAHAVKLEGGRERIETIKAILDAGIPVLGHLGLTPQSLYQLGGYKVQGKTSDSALRLFEDAQALQDSGVFGLVLELVPYQIAQLISESLSIPTIGIGSGPYCDGQVLVINDLIGYNGEPSKKHSKQYCDVHSIVKNAVQQYISDVHENTFPTIENGFEVSLDELEEFRKKIQKN